MLPRHQQTNVVVRDLKTGEYTWINQGSGHGPDNPVFFEPTISGNGRYVAFVDYRSHVPWDINGEPDIYLRDLHAQTTVRISEASLGEPNARSLHTSISDDGSLVAFTSYASNLVSNDFNEVADIFVGPLTR
jgi:Tol biopolymer transport system component